MGPMQSRWRHSITLITCDMIIIKFVFYIGVTGSRAGAEREEKPG